MLANYHTIVVGSGMAGTAAASELAKNGHSVLILEGNDYIGGRTKTVPIKLANQEIFSFQQGANWIHGSSLRNPITRLANQMGNVDLVFTDYSSMISFDQKGEQADKQVEQQEKIYQKLLEDTFQMQDISFEDAVKKQNPEALTNKYFMFNISYDLQFQTSAVINDLVADHRRQESYYRGGDQMLVTNGYQAFPEYLAKHQNIKVLTNHQVTEVHFNGSNNLVRCKNGESFQGTNVVIAVPIGALKNKNISFSPELPSWKQEAIQKVKFGNVCKILIILKSNKIKEVKEHYIGVVQENVEKRGCATYFLNLFELTGLPALMTFGLGPNADELETMPEIQLKQLIARRISVFAQQPYTSEQFNIVRTSWKSNPNFAGAYSYSGVETKPYHWQNMAKPIFENRWFFCGQHTYIKYRATTYGAFLSGKDAAASIINNDWKYLGNYQDDNDEESKKWEQVKTFIKLRNKRKNQ